MVGETEPFNLSVGVVSVDEEDCLRVRLRVVGYQEEHSDAVRLLADPETVDSC